MADRDELAIIIWNRFPDQWGALLRKCKPCISIRQINEVIPILIQPSDQDPGFAAVVQLVGSSNVREIANNPPFMKFLGYPETFPDSTTMWLFRERLKEIGKIDAIWQEL